MAVATIVWGLAVLATLLRATEAAQPARDFAKKSFALKLLDDNSSSTKWPLLGMPSDSGWVLYGPEDDLTMGLRSYLAFNLSRAMDEYASRQQYCEVFLVTDGQPLALRHYNGIYLGLEKIDRGKNRVDVAKADPETDITGGYIWSYENNNIDAGDITFVDQGRTGLEMVMVSPSAATPAQLDYLGKYLGDFEAALSGAAFANPVIGYAKYFNTTAAIDYFLTTELSKNPDGYRGSVYMYKDVGKPFAMGPPWDYNEAFGECCGYPIAGYNDLGVSGPGQSGGSAISPQGWRFNICADQERCIVQPDDGTSQWYRRVWQDPAFPKATAARWTELREGPLADTFINSTITSVAAEILDAVALCDKEKFPRDKYCADAVCTPAINILEDMGVLQELKDNNEVHFANSGGLVSPSGLSYIGASQHKLGGAAACAVKRIILDNRIARKAQSTGADFREEFEVEATPVFDKATGLWTVVSSKGDRVAGRVLVLADGATSKLAIAMGHCLEPPKGVSSRAFITGEHNTDFDGVCFYPRESLPGYNAIFRHPNNELLFSYYLIPCGKEGMCGNVTAADLARLHNDALKNDPFISKAIGPKAKIERMKAAPLRLGGQGVATTFADHLLIVGDAAGFADPLTGEGIHTAMLGGKAAAENILLMRQTGDYSAASTKDYARRWVKSFGHDFELSKKGAALIYRYPILLDACASEMRLRGDAMMAVWAEVMTNMRPKTYFLRPDVAIPMGFAVVRELWNQKVMGRPDLYKTGF
ncbi:hypothetical protein WJX72_002885 [[Myrmecia] bisecta]|uniref:Uncharacterized protein n=1 Tax=[Myrmecia] bisecta TaxID=41462 RepID=A0AAW1R6K1_9CHLO